MNTDFKGIVFTFYGGYVPDYFLAEGSDFLKSLLVAWQPHSDDKTLPQLYVSYLSAAGLNKRHIMC